MIAIISIWHSICSPSGSTCCSPQTWTAQTAALLFGRCVSPRGRRHSALVCGYYTWTWFLYWVEMGVWGGCEGLHCRLRDGCCLSVGRLGMFIPLVGVVGGNGHCSQALSLDRFTELGSILMYASRRPPPCTQTFMCLSFFFFLTGFIHFTFLI